MDTLNLKSFLDMQLAVRKPPTVLEFTNKQDYIQLSLSMMTVFAAKTLPYLLKVSLPDLGKTKEPPSKKLRSKVAEDLGNVLQFLFMFADVCQYDLPDEEQVEEHIKNVVPVEVKVDTILAILGIIRAATDIAEFVYLVDDSGTKIWEYTELPEDVKESIYDLVADISIVAEKFDLTLKDLVDASLI